MEKTSFYKNKKIKGLFNINFVFFYRCPKKLIMKSKGVIAQMRFSKLEFLIGGKFECIK